jgi:glycosyltransferase involved in cell wall biosynthesis
LAQQREQFVNPVEVLLIGGGPLLPALKARAMELGLESFVKFTGPIPRPDVLKALAICDMMILPSKTEGLPYSIIEAMSLKKPVIATTVGGIPEQIIDGETGLLIPPQNATALAKAINFLVNQPDLRLQMGQKAYQRFQTYFTFEHMLREHEVLYQTLYQR